MGTFILVMFVLMFVIAGLSVLLQGIGSIQERNKVKGGFDEFLHKFYIKDYSKEYTAGNEYIIHDRSNGMFWVVFHGGHIGRYYNEITKVELVVDDSVAYQSSLGSAVGRAVVGGVLAGGVGAIIGGVTGKKNGSKVVHKVEMVISFNTPNKPFERVTFLNDQKGVDIFSDEYKRAENSGLHWSNLISSYIGR